MNLPNDVARCPGKQTNPAIEPHCLDCARRTAGIADYVAGTRVTWMEAPKVEPCPMRLEQQHG